MERIGKIYELIEKYPGSPETGIMVVGVLTKNEKNPIFYNTVFENPDDKELYPHGTNVDYPAYGCNLIENNKFWKDVSDVWASRHKGSNLITKS
jgi:hypothetical protein